LSSNNEIYYSTKTQTFSPTKHTNLRDSQLGRRHIFFFHQRRMPLSHLRLEVEGGELAFPNIDSAPRQPPLPHGTAQISGEAKWDAPPSPCTVQARGDLRSNASWSRGYIVRSISMELFFIQIPWIYLVQIWTKHSLTKLEYLAYVTLMLQQIWWSCLDYSAHHHH